MRGCRCMRILQFIATVSVLSAVLNSRFFRQDVDGLEGQELVEPIL